MQIFVRGSSTVALEVDAATTVQEAKALFTLKAYGAVIPDFWGLVYRGRQLPNTCALGALRVPHGATLAAAARLRGGGGDGGSTGAESRSCYLEMYAGRKPDKVNPAEEALARWTHCAVSGARLAAPVAADELGNLMNKEAVVAALLAKSLPPALAHITGLKQLISLKLEAVAPPSTASAAAVGAAGSRGAAAGSSSAAPDFCCPITGLQMRGRFRFVVHRPTGVVVSERALKEAPAAVQELLGGAWRAEDLVALNPTGEELERARCRLAAKAAAERERKAARKAAKAGNGAEATAPAGGGVPSGNGATVVGVKRGSSEAAAGGTNGAANGVAPAAAAAAGPGAPAAKAARLGAKVPQGATPSVYSSIFHSASSAAAAKETYCCRAASGRPGLKG